MKKIFTQLKEQVLDYHTDVAHNVLSLKNIFDLRAIIPLILSFLMALHFWQLLALSATFFYFLDYLTGGLATQIEYKSNPEKYKESVKRKGKLYWLESDRIVRGIVKASIYLIIITVSVLLTVLLKDKQFQFHDGIIPLTPFEISLILINVSEIVSNLENSKRAGFDLVGGLEKGIKKFWNIRSLIKTGKDESNN